MSPAVSFRIWTIRAAWALLAATMLFAALLGYRTHIFLASTPLPNSSTPASAPEADTTVHLQKLDWSLFRGRVGGSAGGENALTQRFRLAGTFFEFTAMGSNTRLAIMDDALKGQQLLLRERDLIDDVLVVQILRDRVLLREGTGQEAELFMDFSGDVDAPDEATSTNAPTGPSAQYGGSRVGDTRWTFDRGTLLRYYQDLRDQPERLVLLFDSLKPVYTSDRRISGYQLGIEGEKEFFDAVGLQQGDVVRRVNNVDMTDRRRAEFFISQFVRNEATAFMLDIERGGSTNKLIYEVR